MFHFPDFKVLQFWSFLIKSASVYTGLFLAAFESERRLFMKTNQKKMGEEQSQLINKEFPLLKSAMLDYFSIYCSLVTKPIRD